MIRPSLGCFALSAAVSLLGCSSDEFSSPTADGGSGGSSAGATGGGSGGRGAGSGGDAGGSATPEDVSGSYMVSLTNRDSDCMVGDFMEGAMTTGVPLTITQMGDALTAQVEGAWGLWLALAIGTAQFSGSVSGSDFTLTAYGTRATTEGNCTYTLNAIIAGKLETNSISGMITYKPAISDNPDCAAYDCAAHQDFSGSRPPPARR